MVQAGRLIHVLSPQPNFIKIDCEGADEHVLRGTEKLLRNGQCVTCEINYYQSQVRQFRQNVARL
jgi:FkbM family methyltransferase